MRAWLSDDRIHVSFIVCDPPRDSWLALWAVETEPVETEPVETEPPSSIIEPTDVVDLVRPDINHGATEPAPTCQATAVQRLDIATALEDIATAVNPSANQVWYETFRFALALIAGGQLRPGLSATGIDSWRLEVPEHFRPTMKLLTQALPPAAHSQSLDLVPDASPDQASPDQHDSDQHDSDQPSPDPPEFLWVSTPESTMKAALTAIADRFARSAAMPLVARHDAFAALEPTAIDGGVALARLAALSDDKPPLTTLRIIAPGPAIGSSEPGPFRARVVLQSRRNSELTVAAAALWSAPDNVRRRFQNVETSVLLTLRRAARVWEPISRLLKDSYPSEIELTEWELDELSGTTASELGASGLSVLWPSDMITSIAINPVLGSAPDAPQISLSGRSTRLDLASLLELRWQGSIDGVKLSDAEIEELVEAKRAVVRLRGRWLRVEADQINQLRQRRSIGAGAALAAALGGQLNPAGIGFDGETEDEFEIAVEGPLAALRERLQGLDSRRLLEPPEGFAADLRPYQLRGLAWLGEMDDLGLGGILADDMGLGKTVQLLALHASKAADSNSADSNSADSNSADSNSADSNSEMLPTLVICPTSVVGNWERETNRFSPSTKVLRYHGASRSLTGIAADTIVLTSYGIARRDAEKLATVSWGLVVADEAQAIKNPASRTAKALRGIGAQTRFALTGTPVQNQLSDLWAILDWTTPGLLGPLERFRREFSNPIERDGDAEATARLNRLIRPFVLRRSKSDPDIVPDLPPKTETDEIVPLTTEQATLYKAVVTEVMAEIAAATGIERRGLVLRLVTRLKQVCNHPEHFLAEGGPLPDRSGKLIATDDLLELIVNGGEAAIVFTQYVKMGEMLESHFTKRGLKALFLHGSQSLKQRETMVDSFQAGEANVFVVSLRAGGIGLNLTAATHVIHYDRWWNPAVEDQASDRAWRIGQDRPVQVHRLICEGTIEDRIAALLRDKRSVADAVVGAGEGWISELSDTDLGELVALSEPHDLDDLSGVGL